ncbi:DNA/RNA helicase domain-containing protein [Ligilactobacillus equi]|uniref:Schlafen group 3-like DNA/RNA helicase domain-containing protein n=1 Tax=Ligilactobacillus equi DSM 15833 = JCM 10991 TaxID=1423740 RepID=A0A0R1T331_9LACO|nr:DNA/RNA helicase domain-containing protein [Ligilactobacillus equi]KRL76029.1 hypothetical protein FC36_GL002004 [Ligilactobacillus equi DSM 15833 = JCM 10991]
MNYITLNEFIAAYESDTVEEMYTINGMNIEKKHEIDDFYKFSKLLLNCYDSEEVNSVDICGWYFGVDLKILPDFDALCITDRCIFNLDLKHKSPKKESLIKKFRTQTKFLKISQSKYKDLKLISCSFDAEKKILYNYDESSESILPMDMKKLYDELNVGNALGKNIVLELESSDYIISPLQNITKFLNGDYWLNTNQLNTVENVMKSKNSLMGIYGKAGTGKTLLGLDIARRLVNNGKAVLYLFSGNKRDTHKELKEKFTNLQVKGIKELKSINLDEYDFVIIDEAQKLYQCNMNYLLDWGERNTLGKKILFLFDKGQVLSDKDKGKGLYNYLMGCKNKGLASLYELDKNIRTNDKILYFIRYIMKANDIPKNVSKAEIRNAVDVKYFSSAVGAISWIRRLSEKDGFNFLVPAGDKLRKSSRSKFEFVSDLYKETHSVIGDEFDNVVTYIDDRFELTKGRMPHLVKSPKYSEYYYIDNELYVNMTRARKKLSIAIIDNPAVYKYIVKFLQE